MSERSTRLAFYSGLLIAGGLGLWDQSDARKARAAECAELQEVWTDVEMDPAVQTRLSATKAIKDCLEQEPPKTN